MGVIDHGRRAHDLTLTFRGYKVTVIVRPYAHGLQPPFCPYSGEQVGNAGRSFPMTLETMQVLPISIDSQK